MANTKKISVTKNFHFPWGTMIRFSALYLLALVVIHGLVYWVAQDGYPSYVTAVLLFFFPICLYSCCQVTLRKQHFLTGCQTPPQGFWNTCYYNFHRKRVTSYSFHGILAFALALILPVYLSIISRSEYVTLMILLPVVVLSMAGIRNYFKKNPFGDVNHPAKNEVIVMLFSGSIFFLCTVIYGLILFYLSNNVATLSFSAPLLGSENPFQHNQLAGLVATVLNNFDAIIQSILGSNAAHGVVFPLYMVVAVILLSGGFAFYALSCIFRCLYLDPKRIISVAVPVEKLVGIQGKETVSIRHLSKKVAIGLGIFLVVAAIGIFFGIRFLLSQPHLVRAVEDKTTMITEVIDGALYKVGTAQQMEHFSATVQAQTMEEMVPVINQYFDTMEGNIDAYLDKYYSLSSEYLRLWNMIKDGINQAVAKLTDKAAEAAALEAVNTSTGQYLDQLLEENLIPEQDLEAALAQISHEAQKKWQQGIDVIREENKITYRNGMYQATLSTSLNDIMIKVDTNFSRTTSARWLTSGVMGVTTGLLTRKITKELVEKLAGKVSQKLAKKVITETGEKVLKKTLIGTAIGSIAPGVGNVVGFFAGAGFGVLTDFAGLKLEEQVNRSKYRAEILQSIQEQRQEYLNLVTVASP